MNSYIAKILATENIDVVEGNYQTASFDLENRVLRLPSWHKTDKYVHDMLVGHEVSHALHTPSKEYQKACSEYNPTHVNVVEDIRIENLIIKRYPGLLSAFKRGYESLVKKGLFGELDDVASLGFFDRLNIFVKSRGLIDVPFTESEQEIVDSVKDIEDWDDVLGVLELVKSKQLEQDQQDQQEFTIVAQDQQEFAIVAQDQNEEPENEQAGDEGESEDEQADVVSGKAGDNQVNEDFESDAKTLENEQKFIESIAEYDEKKGSLNGYLSLAELEKHGVIIDYKTVYGFVQDMNNNYEMFGMGLSPKNTTYCNYEDFEKFMKEAKIIASNMANIFESKKQAHGYARAMEYVTGKINPNKLYKYKYDDNVFMSNTVIPNSKNHGMIMLIDFSQSMVNMIGDVVKQTIIIALFCKLVNIPFKVYSFTDNYLNSFHEARLKEVKIKEDMPYIYEIFMMELFTSDMKMSELKEIAYAIYAIKAYMRYETYDENGYVLIRPFRLGGTPLTNVLIHMQGIIEGCHDQFNVEKLNLVVISDGNSYPIECNGDYGYNGFIYNGKYNLDTIRTREYIEMLKDKYGIHTSCFYIADYGYKHKKKAIYRDNKEKTPDAQEGTYLHYKNVYGYDDYFLIDTLDKKQKVYKTTNIKKTSTRVMKEIKGKNAEKKQKMYIARKFVESIA